MLFVNFHPMEDLSEAIIKETTMPGDVLSINIIKITSLFTLKSSSAPRV